MLQKIRSFLFENKSDKQTILKNTFWIGLSEIIMKSSIVIITILIGRFFGTEIFGIYSYYGVLITILVLFADIGLTQLLIRDFSNISIHERRNYFLRGLQLKSELSIILFFLFFIYIYFLSESDFELFVALILFGITLVNSFIDYTRSVFRSLQLSEKELRIKLFQGGFILLLVGSLIFLKNIYIILSAQLLAYIMTFIYAFFIIYFQELGIYEGHKKVHLTRKDLYKRGYAFSLGIILVQIYYYIDTLIIRYYLGFEQVGLYNAAYKITLFFILPMGIFINSIFPVLSQSYKKNQDRFYYLVYYYSKLVFLTSLFIFPVFYFISPYILVFLFGDAYISSKFVMQLLIISVFFLYINAIFTISLQSSGKEKKLLLINLFAALLNGALNIVFVPIWGIEGAAVTTIFTEIFLLITVGGVFYKLYYHK